MFGERRLIYREGYLADTWGTYIEKPWTEGGTYEKVTGPVAATISLIAEGIDQGVSRVIGQPYEAPQGPMGRTIRDTRLFVQDLVTLHPLRAARDAFSVVTSDWIADGADLIGGHTNHGSEYSMAA